MVVAIMTAGLVFYDRDKTPPLLAVSSSDIASTSSSIVSKPVAKVVISPSPKPKPASPKPAATFAPAPPVPVVTPPVTNPPPTGGGVTLTLAEVAKHNNRNDCWLVIGGNVYSVASYLSAHPGGVSIVLPYCGQPDASQAFATRGGTGAHSPSAQAMLANYLIGPLNQTVSAGQVTAPQTNQPAPPAFSGDDDEGDD